MSRREIDWRLELAAEIRKARALRVSAASPPEGKTEFTEEEDKTLERELEEAKKRIAQRFKDPTAV